MDESETTKKQAINHWVNACMALLAGGLAAFFFQDADFPEPVLYYGAVGGVAVATFALGTWLGVNRMRFQRTWSELARELGWEELTEEAMPCIRGDYEGYHVEAHCTTTSSNDGVDITRFRLRLNHPWAGELQLGGLGSVGSNFKFGDSYFDANYAVHSDLDRGVLKQILKPELLATLDAARHSHSFTGMGIPGIKVTSEEIVYDAGGHIGDRARMLRHLQAVVALAKACEGAPIQALSSPELKGHSKRIHPWKYFFLFGGLLCAAGSPDVGGVCLILAGILPPLWMLWDGLWKGVSAGTVAGFIFTTGFVGLIWYSGNLESGDMSMSATDWLESMRVAFFMGVPLGAFCGGLIQSGRLGGYEN